MTLEKWTRLVALVGCGILSGACATSRYTQSRIEPATPGSRGGSGTRATAEIEGLKLSVETLDRTPENDPARRLSLRLVFDPDQLGYSFDPGQVVLRGPDGREWRASGGQYHPLHSKASFDVCFAAAVEPETPMNLVVSGLALGPKRLPPVTFSLGRRGGTSIDRVYWLEAVGTAILVPLEILAYASGGM